MDILGQILETSDHAGMAPPISTILLSMLLAFIFGQLLAWAYCLTHNGLSYSRSFTQSLIILTMVIALVLIVIGNNIVTAFGLIGALAIVRFRNVLKDTRDTVFVFVALVQGMAIGTERYATAIVGTLSLLLVLCYVHLTEFGSRGKFDGYLRFSLPLEQGKAGSYLQGLHHHCRSIRQISIQHTVINQMAHCTYQVRLRHAEGGNELVAELERTAGVQDVSLVLQEEIVEV